MGKNRGFLGLLLPVSWTVVWNIHRTSSLLMVRRVRVRFNGQFSSENLDVLVIIGLVRVGDIGCVPSSLWVKTTFAISTCGIGYLAGAEVFVITHTLDETFSILCNIPMQLPEGSGTKASQLSLIRGVYKFAIRSGGGIACATSRRPARLREYVEVSRGGGKHEC